jgi:hypothetical protein
MQRPTAAITIHEADEGFDALLEDLVPRDTIVPADRREQELRCISSGYLGSGCRCQVTIPETVVAEAWERERLFGNVEDRFFRIVWGDQVWLGYGLRDGSVRGVYCPEHRAEREDRRFDAGTAGEDCFNQLAPA